MSRADARDAFLARAGWAGASRAPLAGDASARVYLRLHRAGERAVLMDADPAQDSGTPAFLRMTHHLRALGYSAPEVLAEDATQGFLLLEDLGDALFAPVIDADPAQEAPLYAAAADFLADLHRHAPPPDLPLADADHLTGITAPFFDTYLPIRATAPDPAFRAETETHIHALLTALAGPPAFVLLRDFHAQNLLWLPDRTGLARVGLLDYQDARLGPADYDLASLLYDARRDVTEATRAATLRHYAQAADRDRAAVSAAVAILAVQRNLRILGLFETLAAKGKPGYLAHSPRVLRDLKTALAHPALDALRARLDPVLPDA